MNETVTSVKPGPIHMVVRQIRAGIDTYLRANGGRVVPDEERRMNGPDPLGLSPKEVVVAINVGGYGLALGTAPATDQHLEILAPGMPDEFKAEVQRLYKEAQEAIGPGGTPTIGVPFHGMYRGAGLGVPMMGQNRLVLATGEVVDLAEWVYGSFRSACVIDPWDDGGPDVFDLFSYGRSQPIAGSMRPSTFVHTNIPRSGDNGLPRDWEMLAYRWQAMASLPLEQAVLDFTNRVMARFVYSDKYYRDVLLTELLLGGAELAGDAGTMNLPVHFREGLSYKVELVPESRSVLNDFRAYLRDGADSKIDKVTMAELELLARQGGGELQRVVRKLKPGRTATFWVQFGGYVRRTVV